MDTDARIKELSARLDALEKTVIESISGPPCEDCGGPQKRTAHNARFCKGCAAKRIAESNRENQRRRRKAANA